MYLNAYSLLLVAILIGVLGHLLLKQGMARLPGFRLKDVSALARNFPGIGRLCCFDVATLLYLKVLTRLDLSVAYPTVSLAYVLVIITSRVLFKEPISTTRWIRVIIICAGVALVGLASP